ncbi:fumarate hydratase [Serratia ureilytica]
MCAIRRTPRWICTRGSTPAATCRRRSISTACDGEEYKFLCIAKGGGSANKTYLYQNKALSPGKLKNYPVDKMRTLGTAACPPYHVAFVIGGAPRRKRDAENRQAGFDRVTMVCRPKATRHGQAFRDPGT